MDSYIFMNSVRKVKRKQYDNLAVIAFFPPTVFGRAQSHIPRHATANAVSRSVTAASERRIHSDPVPKASQSTAGSSGGYAKSIGFMGNGMAIISPRMVNYMFN